MDLPCNCPHCRYQGNEGKTPPPFLLHLISTSHRRPPFSRRSSSTAGRDGEEAAEVRVGGANQVWLPNWVPGESPHLLLVEGDYFLLDDCYCFPLNQRSLLSPAGRLPRSTFTRLLDTRLTVEACFLAPFKAGGSWKIKLLSCNSLNSFRNSLIIFFFAWSERTNFKSVCVSWSLMAEAAFACTNSCCGC